MTSFMEQFQEPSPDLQLIELRPLVQLMLCHDVLTREIYIYIYIYIYISSVKVNMLTQIQFNGTNFINAVRIFCLTRGLARSWRNGDAQCCQFSEFADPFSDPRLFKKSA